MNIDTIMNKHSLHTESYLDFYTMILFENKR